MRATLSSGDATGGLLGWSLATFAAWGLVASWIVGWAAWPVLVDPARPGRPLGNHLRTTLLLVVAHPVRMAGLGAVLAVLLAVSTIALAALVSISVAYTTLVVTRFVLPAADRLEAPQGGPGLVLGG